MTWNAIFASRVLGSPCVYLGRRLTIVVVHRVVSDGSGTITVVNSADTPLFVTFDVVGSGIGDTG